MSPGCCSDPVSSSVHLSSMLVSGFASAPFLSALVLGPLLALLLAAYPALVVLSPELVHARGDELRWRSPWGDGLLPVIGDAPTVQLSIVVPAYNEAARLPKMLDETLAALASREPLVGGGATGEASAAVTLDEALSGALDTVEVLVVDDGSSDGTAEVVLAHAREHKEQWGRTECRVVRLARNRGKGGAVRHVSVSVFLTLQLGADSLQGVLHARGALILFADADGATTFSALRPLAQELARIRTPAGHGIAVGSRAHLVGSEAVVKVGDESRALRVTLCKS
jgi:dolichyl-phosphate beta-glucosyltransferase